MLTFKNSLAALCCCTMISTASPIPADLFKFATDVAQGKKPLTLASFGNPLEKLAELFNPKQEAPTEVQKVISPLERQQFERLKKLLSIKSVGKIARIKELGLSLIKWGIPLLITSDLAFNASHPDWKSNLYDHWAAQNSEALTPLLPVICVGSILALQNIPFLKSRLQTEPSLLILEQMAANWKSLKSQVPSRYHEFFTSLADQYTRLGNRIEMSEEVARAAIAVIQLEINKYLLQQSMINEHQAVTSALDITTK